MSYQYQGYHLLARAFSTFCISDVSPYHWPGAVTWHLISGLFAKATQEFNVAQGLVGLSNTAGESRLLWII